LHFFASLGVFLFNLYSTLLFDTAIYACLPLAWSANAGVQLEALLSVARPVAQLPQLTIVLRRANQQRCFPLEQRSISVGLL